MRCLSVLIAFMLAAPGALGQSLEITVAAGKHSRENTPVRVALKDKSIRTAELKDASGKVVSCQITRPCLLSEDSAGAELHFILPSLQAGETATFTARLSPDQAGGSGWAGAKDAYRELSFESRPVLRYSHASLDDSSKETRQRTSKVFHHIYDPTGKRFVTNGPGGRYPHHRGIFYGFSNVIYGDGKKCNIWSCHNDAYQAHDATLSEQSGPVLGRHRVRIRWHGAAKDHFADEVREVTAYNVPGGNLIEFRSDLTARMPPVKLDGDPQHAGFHFRADTEVNDKWAKETTYLRPDGKDAPGKTRNWPGNKDHVNLPWNAMTFRLGDERFTAVYVDHPENPKEARFSERNYGRFGSYFVAQLADKDAHLGIRYRIWLQTGEAAAEDAAARSADFVDPPQVTVK